MIQRGGATNRAGWISWLQATGSETSSQLLKECHLVTGYWLFAIGYRLSVTGYWSLIIDYCLLVIGYWLLVIGYWLLAIGYWLLVIGDWLLVIGYWLLVIGYIGIRILVNGGFEIIIWNAGPHIKKY